MKLQYVFVILMFLSISNGYSQKGTVTIGAGPSAGVAAFNENFTYYYKTGFGANVQGNFGITRLGSVTTEISYLSFGAKNLPITKAISSTVVKAGYQTYFNKSMLFTGADAGFSFYGSGIFSGRTRFVAGVRVGYSFKLSGSHYIDIIPSYNQVFSTPNNNRWFILHANVRFKLKKK